MRCSMDDETSCFFWFDRWCPFRRIERQQLRTCRHHATHATHTTHTAHTTSRTLLLRSLNNAAFRGGQQRGDTRSILERGLDHLQGVEIPAAIMSLYSPTLAS